jgi:hypothetical protein
MLWSLATNVRLHWNWLSESPEFARNVKPFSCREFTPARKCGSIYPLEPGPHFLDGLKSF